MIPMSEMIYQPIPIIFETVFMCVWEEDRQDSRRGMEMVMYKAGQRIKRRKA